MKEIKTILQVILDHIDYTNDACNATEMIGAILPAELLAKAKLAIANQEKSDLEVAVIKHPKQSDLDSALMETNDRLIERRKK